MKLSELENIEIKVIEVPELIQVPEEVKDKFTRDEWKVFGALCNTNPALDCMENPIWIKNVMKCMKALDPEKKLESVWSDPTVKGLATNPSVKKWRAYYQSIKDKKAAFRKTPEYAKQNEARKESRKPYMIALVNGKEEPLQSFTLEPEGIYPGRPGSPDAGLWKEAVNLKEVVVNSNTKTPMLMQNDNLIAFDFKREWDGKNHYAARYPVRVGVPGQKPVIESMKKIMFAAGSSVKKEGQLKKYSAGDLLLDHSKEIISKIEKDLKTKPDSTVVALYILFKKGIRIGDKKATRNGTKGLLSIEWGKEVFENPYGIKFDFLGKDSVHDDSLLEIKDKAIQDAIVKVWSKDVKLKTNKEDIKAYVKKVAPEVPYTPKLTRTMVAAVTMMDALEAVIEKYKLTEASPEGLKKLAFNEANMAVAHQLNHQRGVSKAAKAKREEKFKENKAKLKEREVKAEELTKKRKAKIKELKKAKKAGWEEKVAKLEEMIAKSEFRTDLAKKNASFKESEANFTGSTSKAAYIHPKIIADWCDRIKLPIEKVYSKSQVAQFEELMGNDEE